MGAFLVRHGATTWNERGLLQGWSDAALTRKGRREAASAASAIAAVCEPERVVTSPLRRAVETAEIVAHRLDVEEIETEPGWKERSFGSLEATRAKDAFDAHPEIHPKSAAFSATASLDGESCRTVVERVRECWRAIRWRDEPLVVVTHESPLRVVTGLIDGAEPIEALRTRSFSPGTVLAIEGLARVTDPGAVTETEPEWTVLPTDRSSPKRVKGTGEGNESERNERRRR